MYEASDVSSATEARIAFSTILISLFTFLLTFFIMLTSQGSFKPSKSKEVMASVQEAFTAPTARGSMLVSEHEKHERMWRYEMEQELNALLQRLLLAQDAQTSLWDPEQGWTFSFPLDAMMEPRFHHLSMQSESLLQELAQFIKRWHEHVPQRLAISLPASEFAANNTLFSEIITLMEREQFPSGWLVLGLTPDAGRTMLIEIQPASPAVGNNTDE